MIVGDVLKFTASLNAQVFHQNAVSGLDKKGDAPHGPGDPGECRIQSE